MLKFSRSSGRNSKTTAIGAALLAGSLLTIPSCKLPCLPGAQAPAPLPGDYNGVTTSDNSAQMGFEEFFNDPTLTCLILEGLNGNQELKILWQEVEIANNEVLKRRGAYLPFLSLGAGAGMDRASRFTRNGAVDDALTIAPGKPFPSPLPNFLLAADVSWEVDIWRALRNARDAAALRYLATAEGRNYVVTRLVAEIAENYFKLMSLDKRLEILDATIALQEQSLKVAISLKDAARATEVAVQRFQAEVRKNQSEKLIVRQEIIEVENRINFLLGRFPQPVQRPKTDFINLNLNALQVGIPSQLLQNRPDIRKAEREIEAAGLDLKVARAQFYPKLVLTGSIGTEAFNPRYLFQPDALVGNLVGNLAVPLINRAAIKADYMSANAMQLERIYDYQRTVLNAFTEVINRLAKVQNYSDSIEIKKQQLRSLTAAVDNSGKLFLQARAEYIEVLTAQRDLIEARTVLVETKREQLSAIVNAYQALGGGLYQYSNYESIRFIEPEPGAEEIMPAPQPVPAMPEPKAPADEKAAQPEKEKEVILELFDMEDGTATSAEEAATEEATTESADVPVAEEDESIDME